MRLTNTVRVTPGLLLLGLALSAGTALADRVEENSQQVTLNGAWTQQADARASGGGYAVSSTAGATLTFQFTGDSITLYRRLDTDGGTVDITIDNKSAGTFTFYFPEQRWQVPAVLDHLGDGQHTVVLTVRNQSPSGSTGLNVYIDALESPATFAASTAQQTALARVNQYRSQAGLPAARLSTAMNLAAQAHAEYNAATGVLSHDETFGVKGFVGASFSDRLRYFGYDQGAFENAHQAGNPNAAVDGWLGTMYHRLPIMSYTLTDIGYGLGLAIAGGGMDVMDFGNKSGLQPPSRVISTYPANDQKDVPLRWGDESPDPLPDKPRPMGFAISLHIAQPAFAPMGTSTAVNSGTLVDGTGQPVAVYFLDPASDPNKFLNDAYFMVPQQPLKVNTTYQARITGTDTQGNHFDTTWRFTTVPAAAIVSVLPFQLTSTSVWIQWITADAVTGTQLQYGTTTAYGTTVSGMPNNPAEPASVVANLTGLSPGTTYHYQITATDALGNTRTTDDATFVTPAQ